MESLQNLKISPGLIITLGTIVLLLVLLALIGKVPIAYNVRNLLVRWRITFLTALAFTLVVGLLTVMLAFVNGMSRMTEGTGHPGNVIVLSDGATDELFSNMAYSDTSNAENHALVLKGDVERPDSKQKTPLCSKEVYIVVNQPIPKKSEEEPTRRRFVQIRGVDDIQVSRLVHDIELLPGGKWISDEGSQATKDGSTAVQCVLGEGVARILGEDAKKPGAEPGLLGKLMLALGLANEDFGSLEAGDEFQLGSRSWVVTGVMKSSGSTFGSELWAKRSTVGPMFGKEQITSMVLRTSGKKKAEELADDLSKNFKPAVRAETEAAYYAKLSETNNQFSIAIYFVAAFMAIGGVFGVMNTMFAAISQRTKDIGVLRILGFARWQLLVSFFLETMCIALFGGILGCLIGYLFDGLTATSILSSGQGGGKTVQLKLAVDTNTLAIGILFSIIMGALGGLIPALSAMRLKPLDSVR